MSKTINIKLGRTAQGKLNRIRDYEKSLVPAEPPMLRKNVNQSHAIDEMYSAYVSEHNLSEAEITQAIRLMNEGEYR